MRVAAVKRFRAWCLLATFVATLGFSQLSVDHLGIIDTACGAVGLSTGTAIPQVSAPSTKGAQHCAVCHFIRTVSGAGTASVARLAMLDGRALEFATTEQIPPVVDAITRPSRGPPADTLTFV